MLNNEPFNENFPELSVSSVNCNSLNMSTSSKHNQIKKIYGITKLKSDVILLSDIRLCNRNLVSLSLDCEKVFRTNPYGSFTFHHQSSRSKRGVGILINNKITFSVLATEADPEDNFLLLRIILRGKTVILGSIYGPNDYNPDFFQRLRVALTNLGPWPVILGGDWNCTFSNEPIATNIDCLNMISVPNIRHSNLVADLCADFNLTDPYRLFYPARKDFSFIPRSAAQLNRSRIDFFLISSDLFLSASACDISPGVQCSLFDHKAILLDFNVKKTITGCNPSISRTIVNDPDLDIVIHLAVSECYVVHISEDAWLPNGRGHLLAEIGRLRVLFRLAGPAFSHLPPELATPEAVRNRADLIDSIRTGLGNLVIEELELMQLSCEYDIFMEILLQSMKNEAISYQIFVKKTKENKHKSILSALVSEKTNPNPCRERINSLEKSLNNFLEDELTKELEHYALFEHINMEKMTPHFLKLAKSTKPDHKISDILDCNRQPFASDTARREFVVKFYENLYKLPENQKNNITGCIENFLGEEILGSSLVRDMKISPHTAMSLENDINLPELDKALGDTKTRTAAGPDGIGNNFIKKFWKFIRVPLRNYANHCLQSGSLSPSFLTASIRLIPKKGDCTAIKNWRPISLLNCIYKIFSKLVNNRLKRIADTVMSRAQKGFTQSRYIQEVIINVIHGISHCNRTNTPAFVLALDQSKAFDSVRHDFMLEVYKFIGIGPNFVKMLNLITTGRNATIIFDDQSLSRQFALETGAPQGNSPSPLQYNFCEQIALIKIELDPRIGSVYNHHLVPRPLNGLLPFPAPVQDPDPDPVPAPQHNPAVFPIRPARMVHDPFALESNRETDKVESFADDKTTTFLATRAGLEAICEILADFANFSGLKCNMDKSSIMFVGGDNPPEYVNEFGFQVVDSFKLLGLEIGNNLENLKSCHDSTINNITKTVNFWGRFFLSLPGRINIVKTLILSQISYLGCIISPDPVQLQAVRTLIERFIIGRLNIARDRVYRPAHLGGLGMIEVGDFLCAQQVVWYKRAYLSTRDNWRVDLKRIGNGNVLTASKNSFCPALFPIFNDLATSWDRFICAFGQTNDNLNSMCILNNPLFKRGRRDNRGLDSQFFEHNGGNVDMTAVARIQINQLAPNGRLLSLDEIEDNTGIIFSLATYLRLQEAFFEARKLFGPGRITDGSSISVENFFRRFKKGSKQIRLVLSHFQVTKLRVLDLNNVKTFSRLTNIDDLGDMTMRNCLKFWCFNFLPMNLREFSFKFFNNSLSLKSRLAHFVVGIGQECTFCLMINNGPVLRETFLHLFFDCHVVTGLREFVENTLLVEMRFRNRTEKLKFWLTGTLPETNSNCNLFALSISQCFLFSLWTFKIQKRLPTRHSLEMEFFNLLSKIVSTSRLVREHMNQLDFTLCRNWELLKHRRG